MVQGVWRNHSRRKQASLMEGYDGGEVRLMTGHGLQQPLSHHPDHHTTACPNFLLGGKSRGTWECACRLVALVARIWWWSLFSPSFPITTPHWGVRQPHSNCSV
jgi:hypothetical protein